MTGLPPVDSLRRDITSRAASDPAVSQPSAEGIRTAPRRTSRIVVLCLLGAGAVGAGVLGAGMFADSDENAKEIAATAEAPLALQRNGYATREECEANYSREQCTPGQTNRSGIGLIPIFWGPFYNPAQPQFRGPTQPGAGKIGPGLVSERQPASARSGFGSSATSHGSPASGTHAGAGHS